MPEPHGNHRPRGRCPAGLGPTWVAAALPNWGVFGWRLGVPQTPLPVLVGGWDPSQQKPKWPLVITVHLQERRKLSSYVFEAEQCSLVRVSCRDAQKGDV